MKPSREKGENNAYLAPEGLWGLLYVVGLAAVTAVLSLLPIPNRPRRSI
jgi:hypothetical protein